MLLTTVWGGSLLVGRCDIEGVRQPAGLKARSPCLRMIRAMSDCSVLVASLSQCHQSTLLSPTAKVNVHVLLLQGHAIDKKLTRRPLDLVNTGVTTDRSTPLNAAIMSATVLLYLIIQVSCASMHNCQALRPDDESCVAHQSWPSCCSDDTSIGPALLKGRSYKWQLPTVGVPSNPRFDMAHRGGRLADTRLPVWTAGGARVPRRRHRMPPRPGRILRAPGALRHSRHLPIGTQGMTLCPERSHGDACLTMLPGNGP